MGEEHRMVIPGLQERVPDVCDFVVAAARRAGLNERAIYHCQMAVDEACTNVIEHGFIVSGQASQGQIEIICRDDRDTYTIQIADNSPPFNPLLRDDPDPETPLTEREPGGWGVYFIKKMMDMASYHYEDGRNILTLAKHKEPQNMVQPRHSQPATAIPAYALTERIWKVSPELPRLESNTAPDLQAALDAQLDAGRVWLIVDMSRVGYISTSGLKVLVNAWRRARDSNGSVVLAGLHPHVQEVFETVGFDQIFDIFTSIEDALAHLDGQMV